MTQLDCFDVVHCYVFSLEVSTMSGQILSLASIGPLNSVDNCLSISPLTKHHSSVCHSSFSERNFIRYQGDFLPIFCHVHHLNPAPPDRLVGTSCLSMISTNHACPHTSHIPYNLTPYTLHTECLYGNLHHGVDLSRVLPHHGDPPDDK